MQQSLSLLYPLLSLSYTPFPVTFLSLLDISFPSTAALDIPGWTSMGHLWPMTEMKVCWCWLITARGRSPNGRSTPAAQLSTTMSCPQTTSTARTCRSMARIDRSKTYNKSIVVVATAAAEGGGVGVGGDGGGWSLVDLAFYMKKGLRLFLLPCFFFFFALTLFYFDFVFNCFCQGSRFCYEWGGTVQENLFLFLSIYYLFCLAYCYWF